MRFSLKVISFLVAFSTFFYWLRNGDFYNTKILIADLGGIPWLYATIGTLFSILVGFIIQKEWENWNNLVDAVNNEVNSLGELWIWSGYLPEETRNIFRDSIKSYLEEMSDNGLHKSEKNIKSEKIEKSINVLNEKMFEMFNTKTEVASKTFSLITELMESRAQRIRYSSHHIPKSIKGTVSFATILIILLSMFIGVKNMWLDFTFTVSLSMLAFIILLVINDLDKPLSPGSWHLTSRKYKELLDRIL